MEYILGIFDFLEKHKLIIYIFLICILLLLFIDLFVYYLNKFYYYLFGKFINDFGGFIHKLLYNIILSYIKLLDNSIFLLVNNREIISDKINNIEQRKKYIYNIYILYLKYNKKKLNKNIKLYSSKYDKFYIELINLANYTNNLYLKRDILLYFCDTGRISFKFGNVNIGNLAEVKNLWLFLDNVNKNISVKVRISVNKF